MNVKFNKIKKKQKERWLNTKIIYVYNNNKKLKSTT